jgi:septal ring factor EnvC (AmiA/AmiB activator)
MSQVAALTQEKAELTTSLSRTQSNFESVKQDLTHHQEANDLTCLEYGEKYLMLEHKLAQSNKGKEVIQGSLSSIEQRLNEAGAEVEKQQTVSQAAEMRLHKRRASSTTGSPPYRQRRPRSRSTLMMQPFAKLTAMPVSADSSVLSDQHRIGFKTFGQ